MLTSNVVIWSPLLNLLVSFRLALPAHPPPPPPPPPWLKQATIHLELPQVVREQLFRRLIGFVYQWKRWDKNLRLKTANIQNFNAFVFHNV